jgi:hypothetical protein
MGLVRLLLLPLWLLASAWPAWGQQVFEAVSPAARCLTSLPGTPEAPEYPFVAYKARQPGAVHVQLSFDAPDKPPQVQVLERTDAVFEAAVRDHARHLRLPCLRPQDGTAQLLRDYQFVPDAGAVHWFSTVDAKARDDAASLECRTHLQGRSRPPYPARAESEGLQGRLVAEFRFESADQPPVVTLHGRPSAQPFRAAVMHWLSGLRLPCFAGQPVSATMSFMFRIDGDEGFGFRNVPFVSLLASTVGIERQRLDFDTRTMGCPFEVEWFYRQPYLRNRVGEVGRRDPARRPLLEWMETIDLKLPPLTLDSVYGDSTRITIPCVHIDLKPKE